MAFRPVILLPTYNNARHLPAVLRSVAELGWPVLVVNDGSTDGTDGVLAEFLIECPTRRFYRLDHARNRGKGQALRSGFGLAALLGYTHAVTMDTDGQHDAADAGRLLEAARAEPTALVLGTRDASAAGYPTASRLGRVMSNLCILLASGRRVEDSQCGLRVYPIGLVRAVRCGAGRYGYEAEILTRSGWAGCPLVQLPVDTIYPPAGLRVSHFRPVGDTLRGMGLHLRLLLRALVPLPYVKWPPLREKVFRMEGLYAQAASLNPGPTRRHPTPGYAVTRSLPRQSGAGGGEGGEASAWWRRLWRWVDPRELVRIARRDRVSQLSVAAGLGLGAFIANLPIYPVQTVAAIYLAKRLHLHPVSTIAGSQLSVPPLNVLLIYAAIQVGHRMLLGEPPSWSTFAATDWSSFAAIRELMHQYFLSWVIGGVILGVVLGIATFLVSLVLLRVVPVRRASVLELGDESAGEGQAAGSGWAAE